MSLPCFASQAARCSTAGLNTERCGPTDRYRLCAQKIDPLWVAGRPELAALYCPDNGRSAVAPVLLAGVSLWPYLAGVPERQAEAWLRYHAGWNFALNRNVEWSTHCQDWPLRARCVGPSPKHRTLVVGEYDTALQARRAAQKTAAFAQELKQRNGIEGTPSELVRAPGLGHARYRGVAKVRWRNYLAGAAGNAKRWIRRTMWEMQQARKATTPAVDSACTQERGVLAPKKEPKNITTNRKVRENKT